MGIVKTKQLLRSFVWFKGLDEAVEKAVNKCHQCQINSRPPPPHPNRPTEMPQCPWEEVGIDFKGPLASGHYLMVLVDDHSRYPIVVKLSSINFESVQKHLSQIFSMFGVPRVLKSDNGPPFQSYKFKQFAEQEGFQHRRVTPYWPQANGCCERFMKNLGKVVIRFSRISL
jgi:transposase InsO family protein